eukprot:CAMPEP_0113634648 /NCGR_PEP_ID=MMETSP0017_2-20120614/18049_1 /TAXON_ID=2856 /ORGANISM="Cylindrotheca closterium" /LENGTH=507 /DNA_ID=CAMNT_0000545371 /DNA_START=13 /DNA_END=1536 /DNA_ORIENTATION=+ /assembly_acc=CAM_ASM_000147
MPGLDIASSEEFSYNVEAYRAEILSEGYVDERSTGFDLGNRGYEGTTPPAGRERAPKSSRQPQASSEPNAVNVFRRFLGVNPEPTVPTASQKRVAMSSSKRTSSLLDESIATDALSDASAETEVMGSTGRTSSGSDMESTFDYSTMGGSTAGSSQYDSSRYGSQYDSTQTPPIPEGSVARHNIPPNHRKTMAESMAAVLPKGSAPDDDKKPYGWRLDPAQSFSDWEIKIVAESGEIKQYNVHRMALAAGPRKSEYFAELFGKQVNNFKNQRLRLEMPDESAKVFPVFLDFVYGENDLESVQEKEEAYAVYEQAEFFNTPLLKEAVANWCKKRLQWYNIPEFLPELERFEDAGPLVRMAVNLCAAEFEELGTDFGSKIEPKYLQMIFENLMERNFRFDRGVDYISEMILECCTGHPEMSEATFLGLTDIRFLPSAPVEAVLRLLAEEGKICDPNLEASTLQSRSIKSLSENWEYFSFQFPSKDDMAAAMMALPKSVMVQLLVLTTQLP